MKWEAMRGGNIKIRLAEMRERRDRVKKSCVRLHKSAICDEKMLRLIHSA
jgi:hypothetical protein